MLERNDKQTMTVTAVERPERKLILLRSVKATEYFSYCEEMGCEWGEILNSIDERMDTAALLTLPDDFIKEGTGNIAAGIEVPLHYNKTVPSGYDIIELPPCTMLYFQGCPFDNPDDFGIAIGQLWQQMENYVPEQYGFEYAPELAPYFNFGAEETGAKMARPVRRIV